MMIKFADFATLGRNLTLFYKKISKYTKNVLFIFLKCAIIER